ncbi:MAG: DUF2285 domain-containing protein [Rhodospirillales bacterium]|nr:DUF2285 domain-containing protein [Rhodospirillales bacterium]
MKAFAAHGAGLKHRQIVELFWGAGRIAREWERGCWMDSRIKRRLRKAREIMKGYRDIAAGCT